MLLELGSIVSGDYKCYSDIPKATWRHLTMRHGGSNCHIGKQGRKTTLGAFTCKSLWWRTDRPRCASRWGDGQCSYYVTCVTKKVESKWAGAGVCCQWKITILHPLSVSSQIQSSLTEGEASSLRRRILQYTTSKIFGNFPLIFPKDSHSCLPQ